MQKEQEMQEKIKTLQEKRDKEAKAAAEKYEAIVRCIQRAIFRELRGTTDEEEMLET